MTPQPSPILLIKLVVYNKNIRTGTGENK
uniref:Uncharacterized protein n=1 Tax=Arundo donax TaxID=35708 RepID=A0A0A9CYG5_ARUDO